MAFRTFTTGEILTATHLNDFLMKQTVIVCTSTTRPSAPVNGMTISETDSKLLRTWDGSTWRIMAGGRQYARKPSDEVVTNSAALQDDDHLFLPVVAGAVYEMRLRAYIFGAPVPDMKFGWSWPTGTRMRWTAVDVRTGTTDGPVTETDVLPVVTNGPLWQTQTFEGVVIVGGTPGTLTVRWAQNGAAAANTFLLEGSMLMLERVE